MADSIKTTKIEYELGITNLPSEQAKGEYAAIQAGQKEVESIDISQLDLTQIATTAQDAIDGNTVNISEEYAKYWEDGELDYEIREGGIVLITKNGIAMGYTTIDAIKGKIEENNSQQNGANEQTQGIQQGQDTLSATDPRFQNQKVDDLAQTDPRFVNQTDNLSTTDPRFGVPKVDNLAQTDSRFFT